MDSSNFIFNENIIKEKIFSFESPKRIALKDDFFTPSAVLFSIIPYKDCPYDLVIIHRSDRGIKHRGEMSFPGGKYDPEDNTLCNTALREAEEEIGVPKEKVKILGCLNDFPTMTKFIITPFIATIDKNQKLVKDDREVQEILKIPISFFVDNKNFREQAFTIEGEKFPIFYFNYLNKQNRKRYTVWGATAYMIVTFIEQVYNFKLSKIGLRRFKLEKIKYLKDYIKFKNQVTSKFK
ncbi:MAG: NUDIX hydrolase [Candidatus Hermodarchaeota archaeon]